MDPKKDIFATSEGKWSFTIAIIVIAIFSIFIYQFLFNKTEKEVKVIQTPIEADTPDMESIAITSKDEERQYLYTNSDTYEATTIQAEDAYDGDIKTAVVISDINKSETNITDSVLKPIKYPNATNLPSETEIKVADSIPSDELKNKTQETPIQIEEKIITKTAPVETTIASKVETIPTETNLNCVAIIGVFKEVSNKIAIIEKLKSLGHTHSEGILREGLIYVGVPVACENKQARQKLLKELNQAFGIDSWVKKI